MYEIKPEYLTGIASIDKEHTRLFELADETYQILHNDLSQDKTSEIVRLVSELIDYTRVHFANEEAYQKSIHYPYLAEHAAQHRQFEDSLISIDIDSIENELEQQNELVENILEFLVNWLINHILKVDMLYVDNKPI